MIKLTEDQERRSRKTTLKQGTAVGKNTMKNGGGYHDHATQY